jgi:hypothetical protein
MKMVGWLTSGIQLPEGFNYSGIHSLVAFLAEYLLLHIEIHYVLDGVCVFFFSLESSVLDYSHLLD